MYDYNADYVNCAGCKWLEYINIAGHSIAACRSFQKPTTCEKKEITHDE